jgi:hypothetical protein
MSDMAHNEPGKDLFDALIQLFKQQQSLMEQIADKISRMEPGGGGTGNGFQVYESNKVYKKYQAVIDPSTDVPYLVVPSEGDEYTSITVKQDCANGNLKLLGFDSQIVTFDHQPTVNDLKTLPEKAVVVEYSPSDTPYTGILTVDND